MDTVAVSLPLELICPGCENVGVILRVELPTNLRESVIVEGEEIWVPAEVPEAPTSISCPTCGRSVAFGPLEADVTDPSLPDDNEVVPDTGGS